MDITMIISIIFAFTSLILAFVLDGGHVHSLLEPTAAMIVFGGTFGAVGISFKSSVLVKLPKIIAIAFKNQKQDRQAIVDTFYKISNLARTSGLLSLETEIQNNTYDKFIVEGIQLVMDGTDPEIIKKTLENKVDNMEYRHSKGIAVFEAAGGFAPTMGIIGTVMGLVHVLGNLGGDANSLGPQIAIAFIATLYGISSANLLWLPIANKLKELDTDEIVTKNMMMDGILMVQEGGNPALIVERLKGYLDDEKEKREEGER
ncbi:flagellar motor protein [Anaerocolumna sedimenticola]|uniref:Flagellar motor protein n=1 Tax=Anaerocolumna sedimenticola TaxID=2696063 RepID=A0A6P1TN58_9FIRM|nr:flagellar motor protein [Anaerocolumna sedimenticola]QHQ61266.1 flagellar motor protein [Anaerocolumna sedimenticola]